MSVAILASDARLARDTGQRILRACMRNGCYTEFVPFTEPEHLAREVENGRYRGAVLFVPDEASLHIATKLRRADAMLKLVVLTDSNEVAAGSWRVAADYCAPIVFGEQETQKIAEHLFSIISEGGRSYEEE